MPVLRSCAWGTGRSGMSARSVKFDSLLSNLDILMGFWLWGWALGGSTWPFGCACVVARLTAARWCLPSLVGRIEVFTRLHHTLEHREVARDTAREDVADRSPRGDETARPPAYLAFGRKLDPLRGEVTDCVEGAHGGGLARRWYGGDNTRNLPTLVQLYVVCGECATSYLILLTHRWSRRRI